MKKLEAVLLICAALALSACTGAQVQPQPITKPGYIVNACLHAGQCADRPYPSRLGELHRAVDEGLGGGDGGSGSGAGTGL